MKKNGFTLIELLATIFVLAVVMALVVSKSLGILDRMKYGSFEANAKSFIIAVDTQRIKNPLFDVELINMNTVKSMINADTKNYTKVDVTVINGVTTVNILGGGSWRGLEAKGNKSDLTVVSTTNLTGDYSTVELVNKPALLTGMTPVKWNGSSWIVTTENDSLWYNYTTTDKLWANARTSDGSMWVWVPRFVYRITSGWHTGTVGVVDIQFSMGIDDTRGATVTLVKNGNASDSNNTWSSHPAFTFGTKELSGIWVAKFEASGNAGAIDIISGIASLRSLSISGVFTAVRNMETNSRYGWGTNGNNFDVHLTKNVEWGAITYLARSTYGKNTEVWINPSNTFVTGCAGASVSAISAAGCPFAYSTANGLNASTTGNVTGIYDMNGGAFEFVSAYYNNANSNLSTYGMAMYIALNKYKDVYSVTTDTAIDNYARSYDKKGDAFYETSPANCASTAWNADGCSVPFQSSPMFLRGGNFGNNTSSGLYSFLYDDGNADSSTSFRPTIAVGYGL